MNFFYQLDRIVGEVLERCEFYREGTPGPIPDLVKNMLRRIAPDQREMGVLQALFGRLNSALKRAGYELTRPQAAASESSTTETNSPD